MVQYGMVQYSTVGYSTKQYNMIQYGTVQYTAVQNSMTQFHVLLITYMLVQDFHVLLVMDVTEDLTCRWINGQIDTHVTLQSRISSSSVHNQMVKSSLNQSYHQSIINQTFGLLGLINCLWIAINQIILLYGGLKGIFIHI